MACAGRHHKWKSNPPTPGVPCIAPGCGAIFGAPKSRPTAGASATFGADRAARLLSIVRLPAAPVEASPAPQPTAEEVSHDGADDGGPSAIVQRPSGWQKSAARRGRRLFFGLLDSAIEAMNRRPGEVDDEDEEDVEEALAQSLASWFPDGTLSPAKNLILACGFAAGSAWASSKKIVDVKTDAASTPATPPAPGSPPPPTVATQQPAPATVAAISKGLTALG